MFNTHLKASRNMIDVTSSHRPDEAWRFTDAAGHEHRWFQQGTPMACYDHTVPTELPTLESVADPVEYYEDGESFTPHHWECKQCRETIKPGYRADTETRYIGGLMRFEDVHLFLEDADAEPYMKLALSGEMFEQVIDGYRVRCYVTKAQPGVQQKNHVTIRPVELLR